jgi:hypothetical protein
MVDETWSKGMALTIMAAWLVVTAAAAVLVTTKWGIGISPDSVSYIAGARSLVDGAGFSIRGTAQTPITHFPPFYSLLLAGVGKLGIDPIVVARWLGALVFACNLAVLGRLLTDLNRNRRSAVDLGVVLGMSLMLSSTTMLEIHSMAWSEPVFVLLGLIGLIFLAQWLEEERLPLLALGAVAVGLALVTRYAGVAYLGTGLLGILFLDQRSWIRRLSSAALFGLIAVLPIGAWIVRNLALAETATNRVIYLHVPNVTLAWEALATLSAWFLLPSALPTIMRGLILLAVTIGVGFLYIIPRRARSKGIQTPQLPSTLRLFLIFIPVYVATLVVSNSVLRAYTPMEGRILSPLFVPSLVLIFYVCRQFLWANPHRRFLRWSFVGVGLIIAALSLGRAVAFVQRGHVDGLGFNSRLWHQSETLAELKTLPETRFVYSNAPEAIYIHLRRNAGKLPRRVESGTQLVNPNYAAELSAIQHDMIERGAAIVLFDLSWRNQPLDAELIALPAIQLLFEANDGQVYAVAGRGVGIEP